MYTFNYSEYEEKRIEELREYIPQNLTNNEKEYVLKVTSYVIFVAGEEIENIEMKDTHKELICEIMSKWLFFKTIDLINGKLPKFYLDSTLQKLSYKLYQKIIDSSEGYKKTDKIKMIIDEQVKEIFTNIINEIPINEEQKKFILSQSYINVARKREEENNKIEDKNFLEFIEHKFKKLFPILIIAYFAVSIMSLFLPFDDKSISISINKMIKLCSTQLIFTIFLCYAGIIYLTNIIEKIIKKIHK